MHFCRQYSLVKCEIWSVGSTVFSVGSYQYQRSMYLKLRPWAMWKIVLSTTYSFASVVYGWCVGWAGFALSVLTLIVCFALCSLSWWWLPVWGDDACTKRSMETAFGAPYWSKVTVLARTSKLRCGSCVPCKRLVNVLLAKASAGNPELLTKGGLST